jgi:hypothetical protein
MDPDKSSEGNGLRSDGGLQNNVGNAPFASAKGQNKWLPLGIVAAIVVLGLLGYFVFAGRGGSKNQQVGNNSNTPGGSLPAAGNAASPTPVPNTGFSGLSGVACADANRRPIGVMLSSDPITRPVSGFASADMVFELPVLTNDVTRFLAIYQCGHPSEIGSIRSVRHDYLFLAEGVDTIVAHWGGSYHALNRIAAGEFQTINALTNPDNAYFRKNTLPAPYNGFSTYDRLWDALQKLGYRTTTNFAGYPFKDDPAPADRGPGGTLTINWPGAFKASFEYDPATNRYQRFWAGVKQVDGADKTPVAPSVVAIMTATNGPMTGPGGYNDEGIEGSNKLVVYEDGKVITGTWKKNELEKKDPVHFLDDKGQPITFTRGQVWIAAVEPEVGATWVAASAK